MAQEYEGAVRNSSRLRAVCEAEVRSNAALRRVLLLQTDLLRSTPAIQDDAEDSQDLRAAGGNLDELLDACNNSRARLKTCVHKLCAGLAAYQDQQQEQEREMHALREQVEQAAAEPRHSSVDDLILRNLTTTVKLQSETIGRLLNGGWEDDGAGAAGDAVDMTSKPEALARLVQQLQLQATDVHMLATQNRMPTRTPSERTVLASAREEQRLNATVQRQQQELQALREAQAEAGAAHAQVLRQLRKEHAGLLEQLAPRWRRWADSQRGAGDEDEDEDDLARGDALGGTAFHREAARMQLFLGKVDAQLHELRLRCGSTTGPAASPGAAGSPTSVTLSELVTRQAAEATRAQRECAQLRDQVQHLQSQVSDGLDESRERDKAGLVELRQRNSELRRELDRLRLRCQDMETSMTSEPSAADAEYYNNYIAKLQARLHELHLRHVRSERYRKALVYQKKYLVLTLGEFQEPEPVTLAHLAQQPAELPPLARFRGAATVIIAAHRLRGLASKWRSLLEFPHHAA